MKVRRNKVLIIWLIVALFIWVSALVAAIGATLYLDTRMPAFAVGGTIHIYENEPLDSVLAEMASLQPLHPKSIRRCLKKELDSHTIHSGSYTFKPTNSANYVARAITRGWQTPVKLTISGQIRTKEVLAGKIAACMMIDSTTVLDALNDSLLLAQYGTSPSRVFEFLIPDTYECYWNWGMGKILNKLKKEYDIYWNKDRRDKAAAQGLTPQQVHVLASIVCEESNRKEEYAKIASVYLTRLHKGMKLQACPTVRYIYGYKIGRVLYSHLANPSPYNTYLHEGLPPTPICLPSKEHIEAVLNPDKHNYLYFCASSELDGRNVFSETYSEHLAKAREYHASVEQWKAQKEAANAENAADAENL